MMKVLFELNEASNYGKYCGHSFSSDEAFHMIQYAMRYKSTVDPRPLLYALIANYQGNTPEKIRGVIERYETDHRTL